jgi:CMP/dCMP kinase
MKPTKNCLSMVSPEKKMIIAIDGYSSCGKSTFARAIADRMNYTWIDSGAMYRAVTLVCLEGGLVTGGRLDEERLAPELDNIHICFDRRPDGNHTMLNGRDVEEKIRSIAVSSSVSLVSKSVPVRQKLVAMQREMARHQSVVMEGRDIGTVVFPHADIKIFMTADIEIRAERRYRELREKGTDVTLSQVRDNIVERDRLDESRQESPLTRAPDSVLLDNSSMNPQQQLVWFENLLSNLGLR